MAESGATVYGTLSQSDRLFPLVYAELLISGCCFPNSWKTAAEKSNMSLTLGLQVILLPGITQRQQMTVVRLVRIRIPTYLGARCHGDPRINHIPLRPYLSFTLVPPCLLDGVGM